MPTEIVRVTSGPALTTIRELFVEYADSIGIDLAFQGFAEELVGLPGDYAPPRGRLLLAMDGDQTAGCVALRQLDSARCEMKRLYVRTAYRGRSIGRALAVAIVDEARRLGYRTMRLDTLATMDAALGLYRSLGFVDIPAYRFNPIEGARFMELPLVTGYHPPDTH